ncbi:TPA: hypothetical protein U5D73_001863 [Yersinia enterocolitica]|uniref:hypothetical protein n=1 Tax=Yersinia enterocolitica TaxID=630 RepID=UPI0028B82B3A|nr:hypothetical protein [Yersinia enterocolitica]EKN4908509.1 hypothetical protein [Yersinia enterocolitica]ELI9229745.1 hypothetical protein [Yersinia enterocolitica]HEM6597303.1 hypothetical protein [Yersinia enterocolitica]HEN3449438.1 hypothetical protein [Yersinia enterocolitica]
MKPKTLLKDVTFDFDKDEKAPLGPHLAYTLSIQGGSASGYNKALVFKAQDTNITEELLKALEITGITLEEVDTKDFEVKEENHEVNKSNNSKEEPDYLLQLVKAKYKKQ